MGSIVLLHLTHKYSVNTAIHIHLCEYKTLSHPQIYL